VFVAVLALVAFVAVAMYGPPLALVGYAGVVNALGRLMRGR
jgi:hypothetical protein